MVLADDRILEYLSMNDSGSPKEMKEDIPIHKSRPAVNQRCKELLNHGLIQHLGNGVYVITEDGEKYLDGRLDTENWIELDEDGNPVGKAHEEGNGPDGPGVEGNG